MTLEEFRKSINIRGAKCCANCKHYDSMYEGDAECYLPQVAEISDKNREVFKSRWGWYILTDPCDVCDNWEGK